MSVERALADLDAEAKARIRHFSTNLRAWRSLDLLSIGQAAGRLRITSARYQLFEDGHIDPLHVGPAQAMAIIRGTGLEGAALGLTEPDGDGGVSSPPRGSGAGGTGGRAEEAAARTLSAGGSAGGGSGWWRWTAPAGCRSTSRAIG